MERKVKLTRSRITAFLLAALVASAVWMYQYTAQAAVVRSGPAAAGRAAASVSISAQPKSVSVPVGGTASFSVKATGSGSLTYRWQARNPSNGKWVNSSSPSATSANLKITAQEGHNHFRFRCVITDASGAQTVSEDDRDVDRDAAEERSSARRWKNLIFREGDRRGHAVLPMAVTKAGRDSLGKLRRCEREDGVVRFYGAGRA